jgi:hypothetical protein
LVVALRCYPWEILSVKKKTHRGDAEDTERKFEIKNLCVLCASVVNPGFFEFWLGRCRAGMNASSQDNPEALRK